MTYREVRCRNCGNIMRFPEGETHIRCAQCGTEYTLSSQPKQENEVKIIQYGGGGALFKAYIPGGWNYQVIDDNPSVSSLAPVCKGLQMYSNSGAQMVFLPFAYYKDFTQQKPSMFSSFMGQANRDYQLDPVSLVCYRRSVELAQYAYERITTITSGVQIQLQPLSPDALNTKAMRFQQEASRKLDGPIRLEPGKFRFRVQMNGGVYDGYFATILAKRNGSQQNGRGDMMDMLKKGMAMMGAMYGIGGMGTFDWGRSFDLLLLYPHNDTAKYEAVLDRFIEEIEYGPLYYALQDAELQNAQRVQIQGAMQRQQTAIRSSQRISQTLSETSDIINQGNWERSQRMDRIWEKNSEAIRGVNSYTDSTGRQYEADVAYDHVYQSGDTYVGSKNGSLDMGPEWEELKRR